MANDPARGVLIGIKAWVISTLLVTLTLTVAALCVVVLSSTLTQTRMSTIVVDGVPLNIWKLESVGRQWSGIRHEIRNQSEQLAALLKQRFVMAPAVAGAQRKYSNWKDDIDRQLVQFTHLIESVDSALATLIRDKAYLEQIGHIRAAKGQLLERRADLAPAIGSIENTYDNLDALEKVRHEAQVNLDVVLQSIKDIQESIDHQAKALSAIFNLIKPNIESESRARIENALHELYFDEGLTTKITKPFVTMPTDILTLLLVILMGVLGSALQMTYAFFVKKQTATVGAYLLRLSVGAITALVIFIVAKAGVPIIADATRLGGDAPINPYFVSFLAIISGLLSENAIASVQAQGVRFFGTGTDGPDRWTRADLTDDVSAQNLSLADLAGYLGVAEPSATAKLKGEEKIDPPQQKVIALYLRRDPRDIYTDIPPVKV